MMSGGAPGVQLLCARADGTKAVMPKKRRPTVSLHRAKIIVLSQNAVSVPLYRYKYTGSNRYRITPVGWRDAAKPLYSHGHQLLAGCVENCSTVPLIPL